MSSEDIEKDHTKYNQQKIVLLNLKGKSILDLERGFISSVGKSLSEIRNRYDITVMPVIPFAFFCSGYKSRKESESMPDNWKKVVKKIDIHQANEKQVHDAVNECIESCDANFFKVISTSSKRDANSIYGFRSINLNHDNLIASLIKKGNAPMLSCLIRNEIDVEHILQDVKKFSDIILLSNTDIKTVIVLDFVETFLLSSSNIIAIIEKIIQSFKQEGVERDSYKLLIGGDLVDYLSVSEEEMSYVDGFSLNVYAGEEHIAYEKISSLTLKIR
ncbi:MAG: hypothetical protein KAH32_00950 [Chlamydiia bacterium]|nr:hypothetical protein [Chlamydiia bacterium]